MFNQTAVRPFRKLGGGLCFLISRPCDPSGGGRVPSISGQEGGNKPNSVPKMSTTNIKGSESVRWRINDTLRHKQTSKHITVPHGVLRSHIPRQIKSLRDHAGPVRSLDLTPGVGFMSTSNDGNAKLWSLDGAPLATMPHPPTAEGRPSFVLQVGSPCF